MRITISLLGVVVLWTFVVCSSVTVNYLHPRVLASKVASGLRDFHNSLWSFPEMNVSEATRPAFPLNEPLEVFLKSMRTIYTWTLFITLWLYTAVTSCF